MLRRMLGNVVQVGRHPSVNILKANNYKSLVGRGISGINAMGE